jgi:hypothetical protein
MIRDVLLWHPLFCALSAVRLSLFDSKKKSFVHGVEIIRRVNSETGFLSQTILFFCWCRIHICLLNILVPLTKYSKLI